MATKLKRGKLSIQEKEFILANADTMTVEKIAEQIRRSPDFVRKQIAARPTIVQIEERGDWVARLHSSSFWGEIRKGLIGGEVKYFEQCWAAYMEQFSELGDVLATDELMVKDLIVLDIFVQRQVIEKANNIRRIEELEKLIEKEEALSPEDRDMVSLGAWHTQLLALNSAKATLAKVHLDYQQRKDAKLKDLKGSREQRFRQIEESRTNFFELVKELDTYKQRLSEGRLAEKVKLAAERIADDWSEYHEYADGTVDKPFLSPEGELKHEPRLQNGPNETDRFTESNDNLSLQRWGTEEKEGGDAKSSD